LGAEAVSSGFGALDMPNYSLLSSGVLRDYEQQVSAWMIIRVLISSAGVVAGMLILGDRRLGYWLGAISAVILLAFAVDYGWYSSFATGKLTPRFLAVTAPVLGYGVIVFPIIVATFLVLSVINIVRGRHNARAQESAI
jgi:hypothetical protein